MKKIIIILLFITYSASPNDLDIRLSTGFNFYHEQTDDFVSGLVNPILIVTGTYSGEIYYNISENISFGLFLRRGLFDPKITKTSIASFDRLLSSTEIFAGPSLMYTYKYFFASVGYALTNNQYEYVFQFIKTPYKKYDLIISDDMFLFNIGGKIELGESIDLIIKLEYTLRYLEQYNDTELTSKEELTIHRFMPFVGVSYNLF